MRSSSLLAVINLSSQPGRWARMRQQFGALGLQPLRHEAVDGNALERHELARLYCPLLNAQRYHKPLRPGEIGCYASHLSLWQLLLDSDAQRMAVFEDDVDLDPSLPQVLHALDMAQPGWDMVKLIGRRREKLLTAQPLALALHSSHQLIRYRRVPGLTSAYVINRRGAAALLQHRLPFGRPVDVDLRHWWECGLDIRGVQPYPVRPAPSSHWSTIDGERRACTGPAVRLRKLWLQARYSALNGWHASRGGPETEPVPPEQPEPSGAAWQPESRKVGMR